MIPAIIGVSVLVICIIGIFLCLRCLSHADPCKVIEAFGEAVEAGREQQKNESLTTSCL